MKEWREFLQKKLAPFDDIPIIFTSVINKQRMLDVLQTAVRVYQSRKRRISTSELNDFLLPLIEAYPPALLSRARVHKDQVCHAAAHAYAAIRLLRQSAAIYQGGVPPLPRKQDARAVGLLGCADADLFPPEVGRSGVPYMIYAPLPTGPGHAQTKGCPRYLGQPTAAVSVPPAHDNIEKAAGATPAARYYRADVSTPRPRAAPARAA